MALATRIIPTLLCRGRQLIKGQRFNAWRSVGVVAQAVRIFQQRGVDELVLLDIDATKEGRGPDLDLIGELSEVCFMPLAVGGGIRTVADAKAVLRAGADKVVVGAGGPTSIRPIASSLGCQAVIAAVDVCGPFARGAGAVGYLQHAWECQEAGAGEILLTSVDREGTMKGYDYQRIESASRVLSIPIIAHGGCGSYQDMEMAVRWGASAVAAGAMFAFTDQTPREAAEYLASRGIETRQGETWTSPPP